MKFGFCADLIQADKIAKMGYDYIEGGVGSIYSYTDEEYRQRKQLLTDSGIRCESCNGFVLGSVKTTGPDVSREKYMDYLKRSYERIAPLGTKTVVFGSGSSRYVPEEWTMKAAKEQLYNFSCDASDMAKEYGITIVLEVLNFKETNIINTMDQGAELVKRVNRDNFKLLLDNYHYFYENVSLSQLKKYSDILAHVHLSHPSLRTLPFEGDGYCYDELFSVLKEMGYDGRVSMEAGYTSLEEDAPKALQLVQQYR